MTTQPTIDKAYLLGLHQEAIKTEANEVAIMLAKEAKKGSRYLSVCTGRRPVMDNNIMKVIQELRTRGIETEGEEGHPFTCPCEVAKKCTRGYVFSF